MKILLYKRIVKSQEILLPFTDQIKSHKSMSQPEKQKDEDKCSAISEPISSPVKIISQDAAQAIVELIIKRSSAIISSNQFQKQLRTFSRARMVKNISEIDRLNQLQSMASPKNLPLAGLQPAALVIDSMLPTSASVDAENTYKNNLKFQIDFSPEQMFPSSVKTKKKGEQITYHKLNLDIEAEDGFTKELRKMQQEKMDKIELQAKLKQQEIDRVEAQLKQKKKKNEKQDKIGFDYNGSKIIIKAQKRSSLVTKIIKTNPSIKTKVVKQALNDEHPATINDNQINGKKKGASTPSFKLKDKVEFNNNRSLAQGVQVTAGIKYSFQGKTKEGKKQSLSTIDLRKKMSVRMLSKQQFGRVRALNGSMDRTSSIQLQNDSLLSQIKSKSTANLTKAVKYNPEKIIINNDTLMSKFMEQIQELLEEPHPKSRQLAEPPIQLGLTDVFNLNYLKSGANSKLNSDKKTQDQSVRSSLIFPKINIRGSKSIELPKEREKVRDNQTIMRELRKLLRINCEFDPRE